MPEGHSSCRFSLAVALLLGVVHAAPVINEIMYRPGTAYPEDTGLEFIEIHNPDSTAVDLSGWAITSGASYSFPSGTTLPSGGYLVIGSDVTKLKAATGLATVYGPWASGAKLSNNGEGITLSKPDGSGGFTVVDKINYADEGDFATRTRDSLGGWSWVSKANSGACSLERRNPLISANSGQNWASSSAVGGSPGAKNSAYSEDIAPVILGVKHSPAVPKSTDNVTISCTLADESTASSLTATLWWRNASSTSPGSFQSVAMTGDGAGVFATTLPALADKQIVEFYISATDGKNTRTWPAPTSEGQNANCSYQVDNEVISGTAPVYRLILTAAENSAFTTYTSKTSGIGDRMFNFTLVVSQGEESVIRYLSSMRVRGNSSRQYTIKPLRISLPTDNRWDGVSDFNINSRSAPLQVLAHRIQRAAGLIAADAAAIEVRRQGVEYAVSSGSSADYGQLVRIEEINGDYVDNHFPNAVSAQIYRKTSVSSWAYTSSTAPSNPDSTWSGWSKQNASGANDWSDVMNFTKVWQDTAAPYFTGASSGNVAAGTWKGTGFSDTDISTLSKIADLDYLARWLAVMTILPNNEPNLSTGEDDDYAAAFVNDGTNTRMVLVPHDMDTTFGQGEETISATAVGLYDSTEVDSFSRMGVGSVTLMKPLLPLLGNSSTPGNAAFRAKYLAAIRELFGTVFDADTTSNANPAFYQFVDNHLGWTPASYRTQIKSFMTARQKYLLGLIGAEKTTPAAGTASTVSKAAGTLRINEVLASNSSVYANGSAYPDIIELYNAGSTAIDLSGKSLSDDSSSPAKYVFPSGTSIAAGAYLLVQADSLTGSGLHTGFGLDADGDQVLLYESTANGGGLIDSVVFGPQIANLSIGRTSSDPTKWTLLSPSIGTANGEGLTLSATSAVVINEWAGNKGFRISSDFVELYNPGTAPVALGGLVITDDLYNFPTRYAFPTLSFLKAGGFITRNDEQLDFGIDGSFEQLFLCGANGSVIDRVSVVTQYTDHSTGRTTDGASTWSDFSLPTPGLSNTTDTSAAQVLMNSLRITELMYAPSEGGNYEFVELKNIGTTTLDLSGIRFSNGIDYTFASGTTLAPGAFTVVCKKRATLLAKHTDLGTVLATGNFSGALANEGEKVSLTLPSPWDLNVLSFTYDPTWYPSTASSGYSLVIAQAASTAASAWGQKSAWKASTLIGGSPGSDDKLAITLSKSGAISGSAGSSLSFSAVVAGASGDLSYQWQQLVNGTWTNISGATSATYSLSCVQSFNAGSYRLLVTADGETSTSGTIVLTVATTTGTDSKFDAIAIRGLCQTGDNVLILGFVVSGDGARKVLLRSSGPGLKAQGVSGTLPDPVLTVKQYAGAGLPWTDVAYNDNWGSQTSSPVLAAAITQSGADPFADGSKDAAVVTTLGAGSFSAATSPGDGSSGVAMVDLIDLGASTGSARINGLACRGYAGAGDETMIAGLVISGSSPRTVLFRAIGPSLSGVSGVLADPKMILYRTFSPSDTRKVLENDNWSDYGDAANTAAIATKMGFGTLSSGSADAMMAATLEPGVYTVHVTSSSSKTGIVLLEVYEAGTP